MIELEAAERKEWLVLLRTQGELEIVVSFKDVRRGGLLDVKVQQVIIVCIKCRRTPLVPVVSALGR